MKRLAICLVATACTLGGCVAYDVPYRDGRGYQGQYGHERSYARDRDGVPDRADRARDGDGVRNRQDPRRY